MSGGNAQKVYADESYYHIYNRGVEKRTIFLDEQDYGVFLGYLKQYLLPKDDVGLRILLSDPKTSSREKDNLLKLIRLNNFNSEIKLVAYCLMTNHFHFLIYQNHGNSVDRFMNSLGTRYTQYFNKKYRRVGALCQGVYKAIMVNSDAQLLELSRYIHKQALPILRTPGLAWERRDSQPCSYPEYVGQRKSEWVHPEEILKFFSRTNPKLSYESFVAQTDDLSLIGKLIVEDPYEI